MNDESEFKNLILVGSGGCMREILWQLWEGDNPSCHWNVIGYVDKKNEAGNADCYVGNKCCPYLGDDDWLLKQKEEIAVAICVGNPHLRKKISQKIAQNDKISFPVLILGKNQICSDADIARGCIISTNVCISTNVKLGEFVFLNIGSTICHDCQISDYVTISPHVSVAGAVKIGELSDIGLRTCIIQGINIEKNVIVGAGSVVIHNILKNSTVVGVPAREIKNQEK